MQVLFTNTRYKVVLNRDNFEKPYQVVNLELDIVEHLASNLPEALSAAEQMSYMLVNETYRAPEPDKSECLEKLDN